ncbi:FAD-dependent oxidoreductase [Amycolatopsis pigmentata]|uniref:FAD-dependent oxidoreductase n=1 Tax=Amycolatopsis pigmentata TaxID=450801 RepID=A0ABW5FNM3_9PSEU
MTFTGYTNKTPSPNPALRGKRVAIVGAGPGGLSAGIALRQAGFDVKIFERHDSVAGVGGAILLNAIGIHILRGYGIAVDDIYTASVARFKSHDGVQRVLWRTEQELLDKARVPGWISGMMRSEVYDRMLTVVPDGMIVTGHEFTRFSDAGDEVVLHFANGASYRADLLIGADGIDSRARLQMFGGGEAKHLGIAVYLGWCEIDGPSRDEMVLRHSDLYQLGYAPLRYRDKDCFEWWFVEPCTPTQQAPEDPLSYIKERISDFESPVMDIVGATDPDHALFRWVVKYRDPLKTWTQGRVTLLGDACHPTSPYAGYGAGMAIEDGFFLGRYLAGANLSDPSELAAGLGKYEEQRLEYTNKMTAFARLLGKVFHEWPKPLRKFRDFMMNHTGIPDKQISDGYTKDGQSLLKAILEAERQSR